MLASLRGTPHQRTTKNRMPVFDKAPTACLDLFSRGGAYRQRSDAEVWTLFHNAYKENPTIALQILAYIRDPRGGIGEYRFFRVVIQRIAREKLCDIDVSLIPMLGRWDDLLALVNTTRQRDALDFISKALLSDKPNQLCAKWMPRKGFVSRLIREHMGLYPKAFRQLLVRNTVVVETSMCNREWSAINYGHVPSIANIRYNAAFLRNDEERRRQFLSDVKSGKATIKAGVAMPHQIVNMMLNGSTTNIATGSTLSRIVVRNDTAIAMWDALIESSKDTHVSAIVVADTSGSMQRPRSLTNDPIRISLSLALFLSQKLKGPFENAFITFSEEPTLQFTEGNLYERLCSIRVAHARNTNIQNVFSLLLNTAKEHNLSNDDMPENIIIISDMEFDQATSSPKDGVFALCRKMYADAGYDMPNLIFWNVNARNDHSPVSMNSKGVALISGASQNAVKSVMDGVISPTNAMMKAINTPVYREFAERATRQ